MKKKINDLQSEDIYKLCSQHQFCEVCPLFKVFPFLVFCFAIPAFAKISSKEIEILNEPVEISDKLE